MIIKQLVPASLVPRSPFRDDRQPVKVEKVEGLLAYSWSGWIGDVRWFGRLKYGQQLLATPAAYRNPYCTISNGQAIEWLNLLDEFMDADASAVVIQQTTDKYSFFTDSIKWAKQKGLLTFSEASALLKWLGEEELC